jgi:hypothetical protein
MELKKGKYNIYMIKTDGDAINDDFDIANNMTLSDFYELVKNKHDDLLSIISVWQPETNKYYFYRGKYIVKFWDWSFHLKNRTITLTEDGTFKDIQDKLYAKEPDGNRIYSIKLKDTKYEFSPAYTQEELGLKL